MKNKSSVGAKSILIAGSGRSGSTWLLDVIAKANRLRTVFEPLHPSAGEIATKYAGRFIPADANEPELEEFFECVLSGRDRSLFPNYRVSAKSLLPTWRTLSSRAHLASFGHRYAKIVGRLMENRNTQPGAVVAKSIRANLMLGWIHQHFDAAIVHLVRNPVSVVASRLRNRERWDPITQIRRYQEDPQLDNAGFLQRYASGFELAYQSDVHALAAVWCIDNAIPLSQSDQNTNLVVHHEDLLRHEGTWISLARSLGLNSIPDVKEVVRPERLNTWKGELTDDQLGDIAAVLECFEIRNYSVTQAGPTTRTSLHAEPLSASISA